MKIPLPPVIKDKILPLPHFPAGFQAVIFRNWGLVDKSRIAAVIGTDEETVTREAQALGLDGSTKAQPDWLTKGYITIIRANWHILDYPGICTLLGWDEEKLGYILREDDFLSVKLGSFKPDVVPFRHRALTEEELHQTDKIRFSVLSARAALPPNGQKPFDFAPSFSTAPIGIKTPLFEERFCYSYCALYGDTFLDRELIDASFPDELLLAYKNLGITGVWTHIVLYTVVEFPFAPEYSKGFRERQQGMRYLTEKLARYGLKLFLYFNEPRAMPMSFFREHPELLGWENNGYGTMCVSTPEVQNYLRDAVSELVENVPELGGFFTITASENLTNCHSHSHGKKLCPKCAPFSEEEIFARVNSLVLEGVRRVSDTVKVIAWSWGWRQELTPGVIPLLPKDVAVMGVSEQAVEKNINGTLTSVLDYSISLEGPGSYALSTWDLAHSTGHRAYAKMQVNNSWELAAVPYIPAFEKPYRHLKKLIEAGENRPEGLMLSWTLGGFPSPTFEMLARMYSGDRSGFSELMSAIFPEVPPQPLTAALHAFSEAFDNYPFHIGTAYNAPQHYAPANLFHAAPSGFAATMVGFPYDDLDAWRSVFPRETYIKQLKLLSDRWNEGLGLLQNAVEGVSISPKTAQLLRCARTCGNHFRATYLNCLFVLLREDPKTDATLEEILEESESIALESAKLLAQDATLGYESSNHYFYTANSLFEKIINCRYIKEKGIKQYVH